MALLVSDGCMKMLMVMQMLVILELVAIDPFLPPSDIVTRIYTICRSGSARSRNAGVGPN